MDRVAAGLVAGILIMYLGLVILVVMAMPHPWGVLVALAVTGKAAMFYALVRRVARAGARRDEAAAREKAGRAASRAASDP